MSLLPQTKLERVGPNQFRLPTGELVWLPEGTSTFGADIPPPPIELPVGNPPLPKPPVTVTPARRPAARPKPKPKAPAFDPVAVGKAAGAVVAADTFDPEAVGKEAAAALQQEENPPEAQDPSAMTSFLHWAFNPENAGLVAKGVGDLAQLLGTVFQAPGAPLREIVLQAQGREDARVLMQQEFDRRKQELSRWWDDPLNEVPPDFSVPTMREMRQAMPNAPRWAQAGMMVGIALMDAGMFLGGAAKAAKGTAAVRVATDVLLGETPAELRGSLQPLLTKYLRVMQRAGRPNASPEDVAQAQDILTRLQPLLSDQQMEALRRADMTAGVFPTTEAVMDPSLVNKIQDRLELVARQAGEADAKRAAAEWMARLMEQAKADPRPYPGKPTYRPSYQPDLQRPPLAREAKREAIPGIGPPNIPKPREPGAPRPVRKTGQWLALENMDIDSLDTELARLSDEAEQAAAQGDAELNEQIIQRMFAAEGRKEELTRQYQSQVLSEAQRETQLGTDRIELASYKPMGFSGVNAVRVKGTAYRLVGERGKEKRVPAKYTVIPKEERSPEFQRFLDHVGEYAEGERYDVSRKGGKTEVLEGRQAVSEDEVIVVAAFNKALRKAQRAAKVNRQELAFLPNGVLDLRQQESLFDAGTAARQEAIPGVGGYNPAGAKLSPAAGRSTGLSPDEALRAASAQAEDTGGQTVPGDVPGEFLVQDPDGAVSSIAPQYLDEALEQAGWVSPPAAPAKQPWEMTYKEIDAHIATAAQRERQALAAAIGEKDATAFFAADRIVNSAMADPASARYKQAMETWERLQALIERKAPEFFQGEDIESLKAIRSAVGSLDYSSPEGLGESLQWAVTKLPDQMDDPSKWLPSETEAVAQLRAGLRAAEEMGWDTDAISKAALSASAKRFRDPEDAAFMLERFRRATGAGTAAPPATPPAAARQQARDTAMELIAKAEREGLMEPQQAERARSVVAKDAEQSRGLAQRLVQEEEGAVNLPPLAKPPTWTPGSQGAAIAQALLKAEKVAQKKPPGYYVRLLNRLFNSQRANTYKALESTGVFEGRVAAAALQLTNGSGERGLVHATRIAADAIRDLSEQEVRDLGLLMMARRQQEIRGRANMPASRALPIGMTPGDLSSLLSDADPARLGALLTDPDSPAQKLWKGYKDQLDRMEAKGLFTSEEAQRIRSVNQHYNPIEFLQHLDPEVDGYSPTGNLMRGTASGIPMLTEEGSGAAFDLRVLPEGVTVFVDKRPAKWLGVDANNVPRVQFEDGTTKVTDRGSLGALTLDPVALLYQSFARSESIIAKNDAAFELRQLAEQHPDRARKLGITMGNPVNFDAGALPANVGVVFHREKGKKIPILVPRWMAVEFTHNDPVVNSRALKAIRALQTWTIRKLAVEYNPAWALVQPLIDLPHAWHYTDSFSAFAPVAAGQMGVSLVRGGRSLPSLGDVIAGKLPTTGRWAEFVESGGYQGGLTNFLGGRMGKGLPKGLEKALLGANYVASIMEQWGRVAHFDRELARRGVTGVANPDDPLVKLAAVTARKRLDYTEYGSIVKVMNDFSAFVNAAWQAFRPIGAPLLPTSGQTARDRLRIAFKASQVSAMAASHFAINSTVYPDIMDDIPLTTQANYAVQPLFGLHIVDKDGNKRYLYLKIPVEPTMRVNKALTEWAVASIMGNDRRLSRWEAVKVAMRMALPVEPSGMQPWQTAIWMGYTSNRDQYTGQPIWQGDEDVPAPLQFTERTPEFYKRAGEALNLSPDKMQYSLSELLPNNNFFTARAVILARGLIGDLPPEAQKTWAEKLIRDPLARRFIGLTVPSHGEIRRLEADKRREAGRRKLQRDEAWELYRKWDRGEASLQDMDRWRLKQPKQDQDRLLDMQKFAIKTKGMPDRRWWLELSDASPERRAHMFIDRLRSEPPEVQRRLKADGDRMKITSPRFWAEFDRIMEDIGTEAGGQ